MAVAGGKFQGMQAWNVDEDSVATLTSDFPLASNEYAQLISVNENTELIFYESSASAGSPQGIWKYSSSIGSWASAGAMLFPRGGFSVLPVDGVSCPELVP